jgi:hypothetical protein
MPVLIVSSLIVQRSQSVFSLPHRRVLIAHQVTFEALKSDRISGDKSPTRADLL